MWPQVTASPPMRMEKRIRPVLKNGLSYTRAFTRRRIGTSAIVKKLAAGRSRGSRTPSHYWTLRADLRNLQQANRTVRTGRLKLTLHSAQATGHSNKLGPTLLSIRVANDGLRSILFDKREMVS